MAPSHSGVLSRLFLSADLVGSTARKQNQGSSTWIGDVLAFYQQFPFQLEHHASAKAATVTGFSLPHRPALWKAAGDELIYTAEVSDEHQVCVMVDAWMAAMRATERTVLSKARMDLKGGAWIATFPLPDRAVGVPMDPKAYEIDLEPEVVNRTLLDLADDGSGDHKVRIDYLGPSIDIGFRVTACATARRFTVSFEAALAIAVSRMHSRDETPTYFAGETGLKGVWGGQGYPLFWLDTGNHHEAQQVLDGISGLKRANNDEIRALAAALRSSVDWPCKLYLPATTHPDLQTDHPEIEAESRRLSEIDDTSDEIADLTEIPPT